MIDHFGIQVSNLEISKVFYQKTLAPLGYKIAFDIPSGSQLCRTSYSSSR